MSTDKSVTKDLIETLVDGKKGFADAADKLADSARPDLSTKFREYSSQRAAFSSELEGMAARYGDDIDEAGSTAAALHRGWMSLKDALAGSDPKGVLDAVEQGENHAVSEYEKALKHDISDGLRTVVNRQFTEIKVARDAIRALRNATR